ncbi:MAG: zf-HC2 domain-containing protein [Deltaproteobacteria bacterium]|nr:zf-HC2 domain-containing protein [Deltaproteobacteria bacterium]
MKDCKKIQKLLPAYYYKELGGEDTRFVKDHLAACKTCTLRFENMEGILDLVGKKELKRPPAEALDTYMSELNEKIVRRIAEQSTPFSFIDAARTFLLGSRVRTGVASAAVIVILFGLFFFHDSNKIGFGPLRSPAMLTNELTLMELLNEEDIVSDTDEFILAEMELLEDAEITPASTSEETEIENIEDELKLLESLDEDVELWIFEELLTVS